MFQLLKTLRAQVHQHYSIDSNPIISLLVEHSTPCPQNMDKCCLLSLVSPQSQAGSMLHNCQLLSQFVLLLLNVSRTLNWPQLHADILCNSEKHVEHDEFTCILKFGPCSFYIILTARGGGGCRP